MSALQYSLIDDKSNEILINQEELKTTLPLEDLLSIYKSDIYTFLEEKNIDNNEFTNENINFLMNVVDIKKQILQLNNKYKLHLEKSKNIQNEISRIEKTKESYNIFTNLYDELLYSESKYSEIKPQIEIESDLKIKVLSDIFIYENKIKECNQLSNSDLKNDKLIIMNIILGEKLNLLVKNEETISEILKKISILKEIINIKDITKENIENTVISCSICDTDKIEYCIVPCGHSYCKECCLRAKNSCHTCRGHVKDRIKLFF